MKLSEKLAALEEEEKAAETATGTLSPSAVKRKATSMARSRGGTTWDATKRKVRELVLEDVAPRMRGLSGDELTHEVKDALDRILQREDVSVSPLERRKFVQEMISDTLGYGPLDPLLQDNSVTEIMCNNFDDIWIERSGLIERTDMTFADDSQYRQVIDKIVSAVGRRVDEASPMVDARLPDGSRVNAIIPPLAIHGSVLTIRKFSADPYTAKDLINFGTYTIDLVTVLEACVRARLNILVSGGTGTGKTTNLNVLSSFIPDGERIITIEDSAELQLQQPHVINLEARPANAEGQGEVRIRDLVKNALRMRPDRILVGECRSGEALDMLQAMNTGHEGSMTTVHSNSPRDGLSRLETMVLMAGFELPVKAIREQIASAIDIIMHVDRLPDGRRVVTAMSEVQGLEGEVILLQDIFKYRFLPGTERGKPAGELVATGLRPKFMDKLVEREIDVPASAFKSPAPLRPPAPSTARRRVRVPEDGEIAERERLR
ncbi:MAG TPA: CpaF family protein [Acidimicrobiales bacterium]|jgi:pilus assembly protein CpaF|nr:CpaF family protein [Acidimicrobiales bacterium]